MSAKRANIRRAGNHFYRTRLARADRREYMMLGKFDNGYNYVGRLANGLRNELHYFPWLITDIQLYNFNNTFEFPSLYPF